LKEIRADFKFLAKGNYEINMLKEVLKTKGEFVTKLKPSEIIDFFRAKNFYRMMMTLIKIPLRQIF